MQHSDLLSPRDAAQFLSISHRTLDNWRCKGHGPHYHAFSNRQIRYHRSDLVAFLESTRRIVPSAAAA